ncbi:MAG: uL15 family ribosomal protein [Candidatus Methanomethylicia archaeon]|nr:uL15 family ribosomal protein [Candidatus Methanomethylicia archaeon]MCX8168963.1 uL15 family ribosomal protein [Candidatus Methanomethylicia archaeon]MDW7988695.1 uL15 family ribosomal protein [Nitrososphaerota archaeon]
MVVRRRKKSRKLRGSRYMGYGIAQHRGSGRRGGFGRAGMHKHKWSYLLKYERDYLGKHGFQPPKSNRKIDVPINLWKLDLLVEEQSKLGRKFEEKNGKIVIDVTEFGYTKVLGEGKLTKPLIVKTKKITKKAVDKITAIGGEVIKI